MRFTFNRVIHLGALAAPVLAFSAGAHAYLGGFEAGDGYGGFLSEVRHWNEGQYGTNNGGPGGSQTAITPGSGLWYGIQGTMYPNFNGGNTAYATGHGGVGMGGSNGMMITTGCDGWGGPALKYGYRLDARDLNGVSPAMTAGQTVTVSFWTRPQLFGTGEGGGIGAGTIGDTVEFVDSAGNVGFSVGIHQPGTTTDYVAFKNTGSYTLTAIAAGGVYSRWDIRLDLAAQTVTAGYYDGFTTNYSVLLSGAPLAAPMADLNRLFFESSGGVNNAKLWALDDFSMHTTVPAPASALLLGLGGLAVARRRR
ncbi:MAG TPA: PEP-CTERM sorting domain-containing protein [Phycisphaerales bacterium]|nr:PEP-CTERM sorting domain-containing protein [Phycisphaerales bacterium]